VATIFRSVEVTMRESAIELMMPSTKSLETVGCCDLVR